MVDAKKALSDWYIHFVRNRDLIFNKIEKIDENEGIIYFKEKVQKLIIEPFIEDIKPILESMEEDKHYALVAFNTKQNLKQLLENWKELSNFKFLSVTFVNPLSQLDKKWIVIPYTHSRITEESSLKRGLITMFETVEEFKKEDVERL
ncbi:hypothetical protein ACFLZX_05815 [Nanoarchaeota archaeon]